jgi:hypothetical protein
MPPDDYEAVNVPAVFAEIQNVPLIASLINDFLTLLVILDTLCDEILLPYKAGVPSKLSLRPLSMCQSTL